MGKYAILFLMDGWMSHAGGIQTVNRKLACAIAKQYGQLDVICLVHYADGLEVEHAQKHGVKLISGSERGDWSLALTREVLDRIETDRVIGIISHSKYSGSEAATLKAQRFPGATHVHFVHTIPYDTEALKEYREENFVQEREARMKQELGLAQRADVVACIGPRIMRSMVDQLNALEWEGKIIRVDCGLDRSVDERITPTQPTVLFVGRTDSRMVKGLDIYAYAAGHLRTMWANDSATRMRPIPRFVVRGATVELERLEKELTELSAHAGAHAEIRVRPYTSNEVELRRDFLSASAVVMPSRQEGFGLVACEAISARVPVVVSSESGIAEVIQSIAAKEFFDLGGTIVTMNASPEELGRRFAISLQDIFEDENRSADRAHRLSEFLNAESSWDAGGRSLAEFLLDTIHTAEAVVRAEHSEGAVPAAEMEEFSTEQLTDRIQRVVSNHREELSRLPGVLAVGTGRTIVVIVRTGYSPPLPNEIEGLEVVVQYVDELHRYSADTIMPGDVVLVDDIQVACVGPILSERAGRLVAVTAAHAVDSKSLGAKITVRTTNGSRIPAELYEVDRGEDLALLTSDYIRRSERLTPSRAPELGSKIHIILPGRIASGFISAVDIISSPIERNIGDPQNPFFLVEVMSHGLRPGDSGALVVYEKNAEPVGVIIAAASSTSGSIAFARPLSSFLKKHALQSCSLDIEAQKAARLAKIEVAILLDYFGLDEFLKRLDGVVEENRSNRLYYRGNLKGRPEMNVSVLPLQSPGNLGAAVSATNMLRDFDPDLVFLVGVAGGVSHEIERGDVVIANSVIHYEPARLSEDSVSPRFKVIYNAPSSLMTVARTLTNRPIELQVDVKSHAEKIPRVFLGTIASGEKVFLSRSQFDGIFKGWARVAAVEMEGAGVAEAIANYSKVVPFTIIRGIADKLDYSKDDSWSDFAMAAATVVTIQLVKAFSDFKRRSE